MKCVTIEVLNPSYQQEELLQEGEERGSRLEFLEKLSKAPTKLRIFLDPKQLKDSEKI